jgi:transcriptional antiterminator NusG
MEGFWYLVKVLPGKERQIKDKYNTEIDLGRIEGIKEFVCPMEKQYKMIKNKKVIRERVIYTGYLYFEAEHELSYDELKNLSYLPEIMSVLGDKKPIRLRDREIQRVLNETTKGEDLTQNIEYKVGEMIKVIDGPFSTFEGEIRMVGGNKVDVDVRVFGRPTKVSLLKEQIEKL